MCTRAGRREGHFLKMVYGIWSTGLGVDEDFDQLRDDTANLLLGERSGAHGMEGDGHVGIHSGWLNIWEWLSTLWRNTPPHTAC